ncbi:hypothetical protein PIB30_052204 [Stylosanthes scabra]|uniref:Uncharacterized protein n=1 Tax=Stylosanthes scabra TaxID=79078 RepID=A0ABU6XFY2_9FABA|nr:hypothetical protein [Stylosanthes scabra]
MGESGEERANERGKHGEDTGITCGGNKGKSVGRFTSGVKEGARDKVVGKSAPKHFAVDDSLDGDMLVIVTGKQGDSEPSGVEFSDEGMKAMAEPYQDAIVIKLLGKHRRL